MPKFFVKNSQINGDKVAITGQDVNHIINVLRMNEGDRVNICDIDSKNNYIAEIFDVGAHICARVQIWTPTNKMHYKRKNRIKFRIKYTYHNFSRTAESR